MAPTTKYGTCNLCEAMCGLEITVSGTDVVSIRGDAADPLSRGHICPKAVALGDLYGDSDRLRKPVRRTADGWVEIGWDEAFDEVAERLAETRKEHGANAVAAYLGNPNVHSLGAMTHGVGLFLKSLGTRNRFSATSVDQLPHQFVAMLMYGHQFLLPIPDIDRTEYLLVLGANPMASNGSLMTVPDFAKRRKELRDRGGRMVVFDPRRTETAKIADEHHFVRPGTDAVLLLAMLHTIFDEGLVSSASYVDGLAEVRAAVADFTPDRAASVTGVPAGDIRRIAREFATAPAAACYGRVGLSTQRFGGVAQWAVQLMNIVTGNLDRPGGTMLTTPAVDIVGRGVIGKGHFDVWRSRVRGLPEFAGELPVAALAEEISTPGKGRISALVTVAGNPVASTPDGVALDKALGELDFMVAVDFYVNETTRHADIILPPTSALERDHYDLVFHALAVRDTAKFSPAVFAKPEGTKHEWEIFTEVTRRYRRRVPARKLAKRLSEAFLMRVSPTRVVDLALRAGSPRLSLRTLRRNPHGVDLGALRPRLPKRLYTKDKRVHAAPAELLADLARVRTELFDGRRQDGELRLIGRRHVRDNNSWMHNSARLTKGRPRHQLLIHPDDLAERGLTDGQTVVVASRVGKVEVEALATTDVMPGVVSLPHGFGHGRRGGVRMAVATELDGVSINDLTDPEYLDTLTGTSALNGVPVSVTGA
ncbi:anaerobic selenocysteine-containing dehydrogenase [Herbihabitans rhizosphaerae]|uniref:Anaerobic selenocysteine-containing dehydrogenase n=1 Tax=Herbihabitans rhizosphaerae TaxID=1872711 RepID=A0A4Q7KJ31_9PSEU|nr:molybdopterin-dependent oxidoreductase [Herbihabitans rhizosphaerae]RZS33856.1 anaerobic selenocysteine-containing dehydrogenase [Herbihabitans rhizosphaerae]